jgi:hypothetical protein
VLNELIAAEQRKFGSVGEASEPAGRRARVAALDAWQERFGPRFAKS